jgi:hypothetical protein
MVMPSSLEPPELVELREIWKQWTLLVQKLSYGPRGAARRMDEQMYQRIHRSVLEACQSMINRSTGSDRVQYQECLGLAKPWLSPQVFQVAEHDLLVDLRSRCESIARRLECWTWLDALRPWRKQIASLGAVVAAGCLLAVTADRVLYPLLEWLDQGRRLTWIAIHSVADPRYVVTLAILGIVTTAAVIFLNARR